MIDDIGPPALINEHPNTVIVPDVSDYDLTLVELNKGSQDADEGSFEFGITQG